MSGAIPSIPNTPSWRGALLKKHSDNFMLDTALSEVYQIHTTLHELVISRHYIDRSCIPLVTTGDIETETF
jgi:hypothetical protein